jgi:hypothetical protein
VIQVFEFIDTSGSQLCNLESLLVRNAPSRCYFSSSIGMKAGSALVEKNLKSIFILLGINSIGVENKSFQSENVEQDLRTLTGLESSKLSSIVS